MTPNHFRKARTRTLIQLGGLVEKSGLCITLGIAPGDDIQDNSGTTDKAIAFLGALIEIKTLIEKDELEINWLTLKGKHFLNKLAPRKGLKPTTAASEDL